PQSPPPAGKRLVRGPLLDDLPGPAPRLGLLQEPLGQRIGHEQQAVVGLPVATGQGFLALLAAPAARTEQVRTAAKFLRLSQRKAHQQLSPAHLEQTAVPTRPGEPAAGPVRPRGAKSYPEHGRERPLLELDLRVPRQLPPAQLLVPPGPEPR